jgi:hypothetical protein
VRIACWITKALSEYAILTEFPLQQWLARNRLKVALRAHCMYCFPHTELAGWIFITDMRSVYCAVRTEYLSKIRIKLSLRCVKHSNREFCVLHVQTQL